MPSVPNEPLATESQRYSVLHYMLAPRLTDFEISSSDRMPTKTLTLSGVTSVAAVIVVQYGTSINYDHQMHVYSWNFNNNVLTVKFVGDNDTYMGVYLGVFYTV